VRRAVLSLAIAAGLVLVAATPSQAQARRGRWEVSAGGAFVGGFEFDARNAELTSNAGGTFELFATDGKLEPAFGVGARVGFFFTPSFGVEGGLRFAKPVFAVDVTADAEEAADLTVEEKLSQYLVDAAAVWQFGNGRGAGRTVPFVYGGVGYLRELHEEDTFVEEGLEIRAGGGVKWWLGAAGRFGIRADVGISIRDGGVDYEDKRRLVPEAAAAAIWVF
jgi:Outer membrane protein beta-barrel domain